MNLKSEHLKAIIRIKHLRKEFIDEQITEEDCKNFEKLSEEKRKMISAHVLYVMNNGFANHLITYSNPIEQYIDPIIVHGERGIYLVHERDYDGFTFFTNKREAFAYANEAYKTWLEVYN